MSMKPKSHEELARLPADAVRQACRNNQYSGHTAGLAKGHLQCNLVVLPAAAANAFYQFCQANPQACPYIASAATGHPHIPALGKDIDLRSDLPSYRVYQDGVLTGITDDIGDLWQQDLVAFAIGCSFTFEHALQSAGIPLRHVEQGKTVPMFRTSWPARSAQPFSGELVMSMRPLPRQHIDQASAISAEFPHAHGAPLHVGDPAVLGIDDLDNPEWGDGVTIHEDETPVFWGCGVTTQVAIQNARLALCITHAPGAMLITDVNENAPPENIYQMR